MEKARLYKQKVDFPGGPVVKTLTSNAEVVGSIPGQTAKTLYLLAKISKHTTVRCNKFHTDLKNL